ncbi:electron transport complex subunit RsxG [Propionivibrio soli]|uniref:electron transport complex subunit RsxG n=1 Tax=Propionivibrio soli TaxID=2976531 RepID=UPI0021E7656E|nr:electron transport complex subunit RsxG [Propionivibrio soli]
MTPPIKPLSAPKMAVRTAVILFIFVVIFTGLLSGAYLWTKSAIDVAAAEEKMKLVDEVLPRNAYDNDLLKDAISLPPSPALGTEDVSTAYRAKRAGQTTAVVLEAVAPDGYAGRIHLLLAIGTDGTVLGVRATQHKETPGLGDYIEPKKDKNKNRPWITQFDGLKPAEIEERDWRVRKDGGRFDSVAGATVTPRAVIKAVRKAALYVAENRETFFAAR